MKTKDSVRTTFSSPFGLRPEISGSRGVYNRINGPKSTFSDYLQSMSIDDLLSVYSSSSFYNLKMPELMKKLSQELDKRKISAQPILF